METLIPNKECMNTVLLQAKVQESDVPYIERFLRGIATEVSFGKETDFFEELTVEDIQKIEKGREQIQQGVSISSRDLQKETREKYGRFLIYFDVNEKEKSIEIVYFRSSKQESIE